MKTRSSAAMWMSVVTVCMSVIGSVHAIGEAYKPPRGEGRYILTPPPPPQPVIGGARVFGVRPGHPFSFTIPATGERPMRFSAENLPDGLAVDSHRGWIRGTIKSTATNTYNVVLQAANKHGQDAKPLRIVVGETICLTPAMGWSSWNAYYEEVDQEKVLACARGMVERGLVNYGWTYVNIDDAWQSRRGGAYNAIQPNEKFPDMKALCDAVHDLGLKIGIYSSPWNMTFAGFVGGSSDDPDGKWPYETIQYGKKWNDRRPYQKVGPHHFDKQDARQWAEWGIDYLKYDWMGNDTGSTLRMYEALRESGRDVVYSLSPRAGGPKERYLEYPVNSWRVSADIDNKWESVLVSWEWMNKWKDCAKPGQYPDADMMIVDGCWGKESNLTADEQYTHVSLWTLWSSPLILGSHLPAMTDFSISLLSNHEVIAIHQDELCVMAEEIALGDGRFVFRKPLHKGDTAIGLVNSSENAAVVTASWDKLGLTGAQAVRDVWRQQDIGVFNDAFAAVVPRHGTVLLRLSGTDRNATGFSEGTQLGREPGAPKIGDEEQSEPGTPYRVSIAAADGANVYYRLDGNMPTSEDARYEAPIEIDGYSKLVAVALQDGIASRSDARTCLFNAAPPPAPTLSLKDLEHRNRFNTWSYELKPEYTRFVTRVQVAPERPEGDRVVFQVKQKNKLLAESAPLGPGESWNFDVALPKRGELCIYPTPDGKTSSFEEWRLAGFVMDVEEE